MSTCTGEKKGKETEGSGQGGRVQGTAALAGQSPLAGWVQRRGTGALAWKIGAEEWLVLEIKGNAGNQTG